MPTLNCKDKSLLEIAVIVVSEHKQPQPIMQVAKEAMERKGLKSAQGQQALPQFLADFMESGYFVYCGDGMWDLKERQSTTVLDKEGSDYEIFSNYDEDEVAQNELRSEDYEYDQNNKQDNDDEDEELNEDLIDDEDEIEQAVKEFKGSGSDSEIEAEEGVDTGYEEDGDDDGDNEENLGEEDSYEKASDLDF